MSSYPPANGGPGRPDTPQNIATAVADISERATVLVREEIELAKAEVAEKAAKLARGAIVGAAAGVFLITALMLTLVGLAWLLYWALPVETFAYFWGFFAMAVILVLLGIIAGVIAARVVKRSAPPVPTMAIDEARKIRDAVSAPHEDGSAAAPAAPIVPAASAPPPPPPPPPAPSSSTTAEVSAVAADEGGQTG